MMRSQVLMLGTETGGMDADSSVISYGSQSKTMEGNLFSAACYKVH